MLFQIEERVGRVRSRRIILDQSLNLKVISESTDGPVQIGLRGDISLNYFKYDGDGSIFCPKISLAQCQGKVFRLHTDEKTRQELLKEYQAYVPWLMFQTDDLPDRGKTVWIPDHSNDSYSLMA